MKVGPLCSSLFPGGCCRSLSDCSVSRGRMGVLALGLCYFIIFYTRLRVSVGSIWRAGQEVGNRRLGARAGRLVFVRRKMCGKHRPNRRTGFAEIGLQESMIIDSVLARQLSLC